MLKNNNYAYLIKFLPISINTGKLCSAQKLTHQPSKDNEQVQDRH